MSGRKVWTQETLSIPDMQEFLQDQVVMAFDNAAQRTAQVTDPTEGMVSYLRDSDRLEIHDGVTWKGAVYGSIRGKMWRTIGGTAAFTVGVDTVIQMGASRVSGGFAYDADALVLPFDGRYDLDLMTYLTNPGAGSVGAWIRRIRSGVGNNTTGQHMLWKPYGTIDVQQTTNWRDHAYKAGDRLAVTHYAYHANIASYGVQEAVGVSLTATYVGPLNGATPL